METVLYEDKPQYDISMKAIMGFPFLFILIGALNLTTEPKGAISMFAMAVLIAVIYWAIFPRKYCIFDNKIKIALGEPFCLNFPFNSIETARIPKGLAFGINFATSFSSKNAIQIVRRGKLNVNITPSDGKLFIENLDKALNSWRAHNNESV